jgi:peptidoglycan/LPS O-acetylase OafA/YrhL
LPEIRKIPSYLWPPLLLSLAVIYGYSPTRRVGAELCLLLGLIIPRFREISSPTVRLASKWIARYSYGIYLAHSFAIWLALTRFHSWALFVPLMVVLPLVLYHGIEHPAIKIGTRLANKFSTCPSAKANSRAPTDEEGISDGQTRDSCHPAVGPDLTVGLQNLPLRASDD